MREETMTTALVPAIQNAPLSAGNLDAYIRQIHSIPVLSAEEEPAFAERQDAEKLLASLNQ